MSYSDPTAAASATPLALVPWMPPTRERHLMDAVARVHGERDEPGVLLAAVQSVEVEGLAGPGALSVSVGAITLIPSPLNSLEESVRNADQGLYKAKQNGRRRGVHLDQETGQISEVLPGA